MALKKIKPSKIKVNDRVRKDIGDVGDLARSIEESGLLQPIGVNPNNELVFGLRRLRAWKKAKGDDPIPCRVVVDETAELVENIQRKDLTWQEEAKGFKKYHEKMAGEPLPSDSSGQKRAKDGTFKPKEWSQKDTAKALGVSQQKVSEELRLAKGLEDYPELEKEKQRSVALRRLSQKTRPKKPKKKRPITSLKLAPVHIGDIGEKAIKDRFEKVGYRMLKWDKAREKHPDIREVSEEIEKEHRKEKAVDLDYLAVREDERVAIEVKSGEDPPLYSGQENLGSALEDRLNIPFQVYRVKGDLDIEIKRGEKIPSDVELGALKLEELLVWFTPYRDADEFLEIVEAKNSVKDEVKPVLTNMVEKLVQEDALRRCPLRFPQGELISVDKCEQKPNHQCRTEIDAYNRETCEYLKREEQKKIEEWDKKE